MIQLPDNKNSNSFAVDKTSWRGKPSRLWTVRFPRPRSVSRPLFARAGHAWLVSGRHTWTTNRLAFESVTARYDRKTYGARTTHFSCNNVVRGPHDSCAPHIFYRKTRHCLLRSNDDVHRTRKTLKISGRFGDGGTEMIVIFVFKSVSIRPPTTCIAFFIILFFRHRNGRDPRNVPRPTSVSLFFPCNSLDEHPLPDVRVRRYARTVGRFTSSDG